MDPDEEEYQDDTWRKYFRVHFTIGLGKVPLHPRPEDASGESNKM